jgi:hypothetical protein
VPFVIVIAGEPHTPFGNVSGAVLEHMLTVLVLTVTDKIPV